MIYTKKYLHPGEELYFSPSAQYDPDITINGEQLSFAICYDIENNEHIECIKKGNQIIMRLVFFILKMEFNQGSNDYSI